MSAEKYVSPLSQRYASSDMQKLFSEAHRARLWRQLWVILAQTEHDLGLPVSQEQVDELRSHTDDVDLERCHEYEAAVRHDVMAHIKAYADVCPKAAPIIHLGATSCYVGDNSDMMIYRDAIRLLHRLANEYEPVAFLPRLSTANSLSSRTSASLSYTDD